MQMIVLSIHIVVCLALIGLVLLQRSEGGALGMGGGGSGALMSGRGAADALAKMTQVAGFFFLVTSLSLTVLSGAANTENGSVFDLIPRIQHSAPAPTQTPAPTPAPPAAPDPTQSSAPQAAQTQLASAILPGPAPASAATPSVVPPSTTAGAHAAPIQVRPAPTTATPLQTVSATRTQALPATPQRSSTATTQRPATAPPSHALVLPSSAGSQALVDGQTAPESSDAGVQPVRRQRAGPDQ
jgi:preprotein translocase subunit SecG